MGLRQHLSFANVASGVALVVALSGGGLALAAVANNSVGSAQIINSSIKGKDVKDDKLTGKDVKESTLKGVVAASVDSIRHLSASPTAGQTVPLLTKDSLTLSAVCSAGGAPSLELKTAVDHARWVTSNNRDQDFTVADGPQLFGTAADSVTGIDLSVISPTGARLYVAGHVQATGPQCRVDVVLIG